MDGCGGWLITHDDGIVECVEVDCTDLSPARHDWRATCAELDDSCLDCTEPVDHRQQRAA
ncbi:MAG TPA: hypothetical protein VM938_02250 [Acidimicrobiales bacterium]|nr:hypothetical protein [Acidimicrobiales bacterium]